MRLVIRNSILLAGLFVIFTTSEKASGSGPAPTRCIARWQGPSQSCRLQEPIRVEAVGKNEAAAKALAKERLAVAVEAVLDAHTLGAPEVMRALVAGQTDKCTETIAQEAVFMCFPEPQLLDARYCRIEFPVSQCSSESGFSIEGRAWKQGEKARDELCGGIAAEIGLEDAASAMACESSCWQSSRIECGSW